MLTWKQLLLEIEKWPEPIYIVSTANHFKRPLGEMSKRVSTLRKWGYVRFFDRKKRGYGGFAITEWGRECSKRWRVGNEPDNVREGPEPRDGAEL